MAKRKYYRTKKRRQKERKKVLIILLVIINLAIYGGLLVDFNKNVGGAVEVKTEATKQDYSAVGGHIDFTPLATEIEEIGVITEITAYNAGDPTQCDNDPCISASGDNICTLLALGQNVCASNYYDFGTKLKIKGLGECIVLDRMNSRYRYRIDWAMTADKKQEARDFGLQNLEVIIVE